MGRKNKSAEKRDQIVAAFCDCAVDLGIEKASMGEVAARVGIDRSTMHYYFKTREQLVIEAAKYITRFYTERIAATMATLDPRNKSHALVESLFSAAAHDERKSSLLDELGALGNREPFFREQVKSVYSGIETEVSRVLDETLPAAIPPKERRLLAQALMQLSEGATVFVALGFNRTWRLAARQAGLQLLDDLLTKYAPEG